jgi:serine/threonine-protein kinase
VGRYEVISHLATGGMAQIFLARQTGLGSFERHVVLKTIVRERASDQRFVMMFLDEAKLAATLNHQNVAQVYEVDQADGAYFMAMEYVHGENARAILEMTIRRGWTIPLELALMIVGGAAAGLHHAHERRGKGGQPLNIVHRDVSPANIMVGFDGSVKVLDFGIAKAEERATKTLGGTIKGKYGYMSPEQCKGKQIDRRSDIFALGIVLYELTTLRRAFKGNDDFETMKLIVAGDYMRPSVAVPGYPRELDQIVQTALAADPAARFQTAQQLLEALDAFAVREKLTGTNTALGRYMVQLFGSKKEPWVATTSQDATEISDPAVGAAAAAVAAAASQGVGEGVSTAVGGAAARDDDDDDEGDEDDEELDDAQTIVAGPRVAISRVPTELGTEAPRAPADAAAWANEPAYVPPQRRSSQRPAATPEASGRLDPSTMTLSSTTPVPQRVTPAAMAATPSPQRVTPVSVAAQAAALPQLSPMPPLPDMDEAGELGAQPLLVDDPKLGWQTSPENRLMRPSTQPAGTRLPSEGAALRVTSSRWWLVLALLIVLGVTGAVAAYTLELF